MKIKHGKGTTKYGTGVQIDLTGNEVALAIMAYLTARDVHTFGAMTIRVNGKQIEEGSIYVDPSGFVIDKKGVKWDGAHNSKQ